MSKGIRPHSPIPPFPHSSTRPLAILLCLLAFTLLVLPAWAEDDGMLHLKNADHVKFHPDKKLSATGSVEMTYKDYKITGDSMEADLETNIAVFEGNVVLNTAGTDVKGEKLTVNLKTKYWEFANAGSRIEPSAFDGKVKGPAFVSGAELSGSGEEVKIESGTLTTCDKEHPHYVFKAREIEIYPDSKIVAHKVSMVGLEKTLFTLSTLLIPLRGLRTTNILPQIGSSVEEGSFLKTSYAYSATESNQGFLKLDLMSKRGTGAGLDHSYRVGLGNGQATLYYLQDKELGGSNITGTIRHNQKFGEVSMDLTGNYRTNNYLYYPSTTSQNWQLGLNRNSNTASTSLTFRNDKSSGFGDTTNLSSSFRHTQQFTDKLNGVFSMDMRSYDSDSLSSADEELDSVLEMRQRGDKYDLSLIASKRTDLDGDAYTNDNFYGGLDRLPEITFDTDSYRLGEKLFFGIPSRLSLVAGSYLERPNNTERGRIMLQWDMLGKNVDISDKNELNLTGGFRQAFYGKNMAQYVMRTNATLTTRYSDYLKSRVAYSYQRPEGFSPFLFDYTGKYNYLRTTLDFQKKNDLRWSLATGYDLNRSTNPWQDVTLRFTAHPNPVLAYSISTGYDINRSTWRSMIGRLQIHDTKRLRVDLGTRYDLDGGGLSTARAQFDWWVNDKWRIEGLTGWNGELKKWDYQAYRLTRDLHCCEVSLTWRDETGFRQDKGFSLDFRIKALPYQDRFGIGQFGQQLDTSMGEYLY